MHSNNDIRQTLNHIFFLSSRKEMSNNNHTNTDFNQKNLKFGPWDVVRKVFSAEEHKNMTFENKSDLFFHDYSLGPLFVQQNYLSVSTYGSQCEVMEKIAMAADALSLGDMVEKKIRTNSSWHLLPTQAVFSSVMPGEYMKGRISGQINFPIWLGKTSKSNKRIRLAQEIHNHTRIRTSASRLSIRLDYLPFILDNVIRPLRNKGINGITESLNVMKEYRLLRGDIDTLVELNQWQGKPSAMDNIDGRIKAALTRSYNKQIRPYSYSSLPPAKKQKVQNVSEIDDLMEVDGFEDGEDDDHDDDCELSNDALVKIKNSKKVSKAKSKKTLKTNK